MTNLSPNFWAKVNKTETCWLWVGATDRGYGRFWVDNRAQRAHRLAYVDAYGEIPDGLELDHTCVERSCVRPDHIEAVTHVENVKRAWRRRFPGRDFSESRPRSGKSRRATWRTTAPVGFKPTDSTLPLADRIRLSPLCRNGHTRTTQNTGTYRSRLRCLACAAATRADAA